MGEAQTEGEMESSHPLPDSVLGLLTTWQGGWSPLRGNWDLSLPFSFFFFQSFSLSSPFLHKSTHTQNPIFQTRSLSYIHVNYSVLSLSPLLSKLSPTLPPPPLRIPRWTADDNGWMRMSDSDIYLKGSFCNFRELLTGLLFFFFFFFFSKKETLEFIHIFLFLLLWWWWWW